MATLTERLAIVVEANAGQAIASFKQLGAEAKGLGGPIGEAGGLMKSFAGQLQGLAGAAGPAAGIAAATAVGAALVKFAEDGVAAFSDLAGQVRSVQRVMGGTTQDASRLVAVANVLGVSTESLTLGMGQLEKHLGANADLARRYGIEIVKDAQGNVNMFETLVSVSKAYQAAQNPIERATMLNNLFGRSWQQLLPILAKGPAGIRAIAEEAGRQGLILSPEDLARAAQLNLALKELRESVKGLQVEAGRALIPAVLGIVNAVDTVLARVADVIQGPPPDQGGAWNFIADQANKYVRTIEGIPELLFHIGNAGKTASETLAPTAQDLDDVSNALATMVNSDRALAASQRSLEADRRSLTRDTEDYNKLLKEGAVDAQKVADAQRSLDDATRSLHHSQREQAKAQDEYNKALAAFNVLGTDTARDKLVDAQNNLADANDSVASAQERQQAAQRELDKQRAGDPDYQTKLADAKQKVADDTQRIADAEYDVGQKSLANIDAHNKEATAIAGKADVAERLLSDYNQLIKQHPELEAILGPQQPALVGAVVGQDLGNITSGVGAAPAPSVAPTGGGGGTSIGGKLVNVFVDAKGVLSGDPSALADMIGKSVSWFLR